MAPPVVSIIIPSYNRAHLIGETLDSVVAQTFRDWEVIVIDDGSSDQTADVMSDWCQRDSRIRFVQQPNGGVSTARNHGLRLARGEFVAFLDSDDLWVPWKLEVQVALLRKLTNVGMIWSDMDAIDEVGQPLQSRYLRTMYASYRGRPEHYPFSGSKSISEVLDASLVPESVPPETAIRTGQILRPMVFGNLVHTSTVLLRKTVADQVGPFDETMRRAGEDYDYHLRTCAVSDVAYLDVSTMKYRIGMGDQITHPSNNLYFARSYLLSIQSYLKTPGLLQTHEQHAVLASAHRWLGEQLLEHGERMSALRELTASLRHQPRSWETIKLMAKGGLPAGLVGLMRKWRTPKTTSAAW